MPCSFCKLLVSRQIFLGKDYRGDVSVQAERHLGPRVAKENTIRKTTPQFKGPIKTTIAWRF